MKKVTKGKWNSIWQNALDKSLQQIKRQCYSEDIYSTQLMKKVMLKEALLEFIQIYFSNTRSCEEELATFFGEPGELAERVSAIL